MYALGYQLMLENRQDQKRIKLIKLPNTYMQINGYKPQPLDLNNITLNAKIDTLVEKLAENTHNVWARNKIQEGWTYGVLEVIIRFLKVFSLYSVGVSLTLSK